MHPIAGKIEAGQLHIETPIFIQTAKLKLFATKPKPYILNPKPYT